eukprot:Plantae.Rhodophyta-Purpureofilum_apyrenoidigerum.ctg8649.p1 GENE.Plantae.Rhodophyta-Purpureofilum_apyrenoidigerum.ctg8649~~Plantae.Rhodophyta-Purpureofilum_apyrenoidigerum.ctg8649.p1  ORF type:complete len:579 (-),score=78.69 Plantae.Rhodophyta-Purpureofilum_apyrenoidigerum.ctg8649:1599-3335(-)
MWLLSVWTIWLALVGLGLLLGFLSTYAAKTSRFNREKKRKLLRHREGIVNFGVSKQDVDNVARRSLTTTFESRSAEHVARAQCFRARWAADIFNAVAEECYLDAILKAKALDRENSQVGPLHGVPVTVSDVLATADLESAAGTIEHCVDGASEVDCAAVEAFRRAGALIICKSTVSTSGALPAETVSPLFGRTLNPWNKELPTGGPGGGGAVLTALGVGKLHLGVQCLQSAAFLGVPGFMFTKERASCQGKRPVPGPPQPICILGSDLQAIVTGASVLLEPILVARSDPQVIPMPLDHEALTVSDQLTIGILDGDDYNISPLGPEQHALRALTERGHKVVKFKSPVDLQCLVILQTALLTSERLRHLTRIQDPQREDKLLDKIRLYFSLPELFRFFLARALEKEMSPRHREWILRGISLGLDDKKYPTLLRMRENFRSELVKGMVEDHIDLLVIGTSSPNTRCKGKISLADAFGGIEADFSVLNLPVGIIPVKAKSNGPQSLNQDQWCTGTSQPPGSVTIVVPPWQEELCLRVMIELEEQLGKPDMPPANANFSRYNGPLPGGAIANEDTPLMQVQDS